MHYTQANDNAKLSTHIYNAKNNNDANIKSTPISTTMQGYPPPQQCATGYPCGQQPGQYYQPSYQQPQPVYQSNLSGQAATAEVHLMRAHAHLSRAMHCLGKSLGWNNINQYNTMIGTFERGLLTGGDNMLGAMDVMGEKRGVHRAQRHVEAAMIEVQAAAAFYPSMPMVHCAIVRDNNTMMMLLFDNVFTNMSERRKLEQSMMSVQNMLMEVDRNINILRTQGGF